VKTATLARKTKRPPIGTTFTFTLNTAASVNLVFTQTVPGSRVAGRCVALIKRAKRGHTCKRTVTAGTLTFPNAHPGIDRIAFQGSLSRSKRLRPGRYTLTVAAANPSGRAVGQRLTFTIVNH
jgi:hypothetical protein